MLRHRGAGVARQSQLDGERRKGGQRAASADSVAIGMGGRGHGAQRCRRRRVQQTKRAVEM